MSIIKTLKVDSNQDYNDDRMRIVYPSIQNDEETSGLLDLIQPLDSLGLLRRKIAILF